MHVGGGGGGIIARILPVPKMLMGSMSPAASVTVNAAVRKPVVVGENCTTTAQNAPAARLPVQVLVATVKSPGAKLDANPGITAIETERPLTGLVVVI